MDWLRVIFVCGLIMIHVAAMFDPYPITAVKGQRSFPLVLFATFLHEWRLAILFIVSGAGTYFALGFLTGKQYLLMRFKRIVVPLVFGTFFIVPFHLYAWQFQGNRGYSKTFPEFYATIMYRFFVHGIFGTARETLHYAHLWFLAYLFVSSLVALPLLLYLRHGKGQDLVLRLADFIVKPWAIYLFAVPIVLLEVSLQAATTSGRSIIVGDWCTFFVYLTLFIYGFLIFSHDNFRRALEAHRLSGLIAGIVTSTVYLIIVFGFRTFPTGYNTKFELYIAWRGFSIWCWCIAVLGYASRHLNFTNRALPYLNEAVYPVYVVHLPLVTYIALVVLRLPLPPLLQFAIIVILAIGTALLIFEVIRRTTITRFLFGLKLKKRKHEEQVPAAEIPAAEPPAVEPSAVEPLAVEPMVTPAAPSA